MGDGSRHFQMAEVKTRADTIIHVWTDTFLVPKYSFAVGIFFRLR